MRYVLICHRCHKEYEFLPGICLFQRVGESSDSLRVVGSIHYEERVVPQLLDPGRPLYCADAFEYLLPAEFRSAKCQGRQGCGFIIVLEVSGERRCQFPILCCRNKAFSVALILIDIQINVSFVFYDFSHTRWVMCHD